MPLGGGVMLAAGVGRGEGGCGKRGEEEDLGQTAPYLGS
jgi:hypothetical protein